MLAKTHYQTRLAIESKNSCKEIGLVCLAAPKKRYGFLLLSNIDVVSFTAVLIETAVVVVWKKRQILQEIRGLEAARIVEHPALVKLRSVHYKVTDASKGTSFGDADVRFITFF